MQRRRREAGSEGSMEQKTRVDEQKTGYEAPTLTASPARRKSIFIKNGTCKIGVPRGVPARKRLKYPRSLFCVWRHD